MENRADKPVVLIVEDDEDLATVIRAYLTKAGVDVRIAHNGRNAVDTLAQTPADLMLLDLGLPDMSGAELIAALRNRGVHVPFIVISGQDDQRTAVEMMKNGARDFIIKGSAFLDLLPSAVLQAIEQIRRDRRLAQAEQRIHEQNQFLQSILNSLPHPLYVIDAKTYAVQMANEAACLSLHNALPGQPLGTSESAKLTSGPAADSAIDEVKRTGRPLTLEHVQYDQERRSSIHEIHVCPVFAEEGGEVRQIIEYDLDVTTRKQAEQALRESEARLRQVVESLPIVLVSHAPQGRATLIIGAVQEMLGYEVSQLLDEPQAMAKVVHPEDIEQVLSTARAALTEHRSFELDFRVRHGTEQKDVWVHAQGVPVWDEEGALVRVDSILVDRTEERRIAAERERLESHLRQTQRLESLGNLAGGISHDFNNLLTVISGNISFLRQSASWSPTQSKALADIENATENATDMTKALEAFSQPSRPRWPTWTPTSSFRTCTGSCADSSPHVSSSHSIPPRCLAGWPSIPANSSKC
jgi:PAS domain S-box-containing protein